MLAVEVAGWLEAVIAGIGAGDAVAGEGDRLAVADVGVGEGGGAVVEVPRRWRRRIVQPATTPESEPLPVTLSAGGAVIDLVGAAQAGDGEGFGGDGHACRCRR